MTISRDTSFPAKLSRLDQHAWQPSEEVTGHQGEALDPTLIFFSPPPLNEIGKIITAHSVLTQDFKPKIEAKWRWLIAAAIPLLGIASCIVAGLAMPTNPETGEKLFGFAALVFISLPAFLLATITKVSCAYVGELGAAKFTATYPPRGPAKSEQLRFEDASDLISGERTQIDEHGTLVSICYFFRWVDDKGKPLCAFAGTYGGPNCSDASNDAYHFAKSAEQSWIWFLQAALDDELQSCGFIQFKLRNGATIHVAPQYIEWQLKGKTIRLERSDIEGVQIKNGMFTIWVHGASIQDPNSILKFAYSDLCNAQVFLHSLDSVCNLQSLLPHQ